MSTDTTQSHTYGTLPARYQHPYLQIPASPTSPVMDDAFLDFMFDLQWEEEPTGCVEPPDWLAPPEPPDAPPAHSLNPPKPTPEENPPEPASESYPPRPAPKKMRVGNVVALPVGTQVDVPDAAALVTVSQDECFQKEFCHLPLQDVAQIIETGKYFVLQPKPRGIVKSTWETSCLSREAFKQVCHGMCTFRDLLTEVVVFAPLPVAKQAVVDALPFCVQPHVELDVDGVHVAIRQRRAALRYSRDHCSYGVSPSQEAAAAQQAAEPEPVPILSHL